MNWYTDMITGLYKKCNPEETVLPSVFKSCYNNLRISGRGRHVMLTEEKLENLILKYDIPYNHNIALARRTTGREWVLPDTLENVKEFEKAEYFYVCFSEQGICIFPALENWNSGEPLVFGWKQITGFEVKKGWFTENDLRLSSGKVRLRLKLVKKMANNSWVRENMIFLDSVNYYRR